MRTNVLIYLLELPENTWCDCIYLTHIIFWTENITMRMDKKSVIKIYLLTTDRRYKMELRGEISDNFFT